MTHINTYNPLFTSNKYQSLEGQLNEIKTFLYTVSNGENISIGGIPISQHIENILQRLSALDNTDWESFLTTDHQIEVRNELEKIQATIDSIMREIIAPTSSILYDTEEKKYSLSDDIQKTIIERINEIIDVVSGIISVFKYYNYTGENDEPFEGVIIPADISTEEKVVNLIKIDKKLDSVELGYIEGEKKSNIDINGKIKMNFIENLEVIQNFGANITTLKKNFNMTADGIHLQEVLTPSANDPATSNESRDIYIPNGLRFLLLNVSGEQALVIRKPGVYSSSADNMSGLCPTDIILHFGTEYKPEEIPEEIPENPNF
jgi:hypothetical protein